MKPKLFGLLFKRLAALFQVVGIQSSWRRNLYIVYAIGGFFLLTACTSAPLIEGLEFENESIVSVLTKALHQDPFFEQRTRCIFVLTPGTGVNNIYNNEKFIALRQILIERGLYKKNEKCRNFDFDEQARSAADPQKFVDSPEIPIGVLIYTGTFFLNQVKSEEVFRIFRKIYEEYCKENQCEIFHKQKIQTLSVAFSQCRTVYYSVYGIGAAVLHSEMGPGGLCVSY
jgi:hypothetical protein